MPSLIQIQPISNQTSREDASSQEYKDGDEQLLKTIGEIYSPVLKAMKWFGFYFRDASLTHLSSAGAAKNGRKRNIFTLLYCVVVLAGHWFNFVMAFTDIFFGKNPFVFMMFCVWCLLIALSGLVCLFVLCVSFSDTGHSRFENFVLDLSALDIRVDLEKLKKKSRKGIAAFWILFIIFGIGVFATNFHLNMKLAYHKPWNAWPGLNIFSVIFLFIGSSLWILPVLLHHITCEILKELFDDLHRRMSSGTSNVSMGFEAFKMEHHKLCGVVASADKVLSPLLLEMVGLYIPLMILNLFKIINLPHGADKYEFLASNIFWLLVSIFFLSIIMSFGSSISEKISSFKVILQTFPVSKEDEGKLLLFVLDLQDEPKGLSLGGYVVITKSLSLTIHSFQKIFRTAPIAKEDEGKLVVFMLDLQGDPKGISIGGLVVITKSLSLTIAGVIISYFTVLLSMPK